MRKVGVPGVVLRALLALTLGAGVTLVARPAPRALAIITGVTVTVSNTRVSAAAAYTITWRTSQAYAPGFVVTVDFPDGMTLDTAMAIQAGTAVGASTTSGQAATQAASLANVSTVAVALPGNVVTVTTQTLTAAANTFIAVLFGAGLTNPATDTAADPITVDTNQGDEVAAPPVASADIHYDRRSQVLPTPTTAGTLAEWVVAYEAPVDMIPGATLFIQFPEGTIFNNAAIPKSAVSIAMNKDLLTLGNANGTLEASEFPLLGFVCLGDSDPDPILDIANRTLRVAVPSGTSGACIGTTTLEGRVVVARVTPLAGIKTPALSREGGFFGTYVMRLSSTAVGTGAVSLGFTINAFVTFSPLSGPRLTPVTVRGGGFTPNSTVTIMTDILQGANGPVGADGTFTILTNALMTGRITVRDGTGRTATSEDPFIQTPRLSASPTTVRAGDNVNLVGREYQRVRAAGNDFPDANPQALGDVRIGGVPVPVSNVQIVQGGGSLTGIGFLTPVNTDNDAEIDDFELVLRIPSDTPPGAKAIEVLNDGSNVLVGTTTVTVAERTVTLSPSAGPPGTLVTVQGANFPSGVPAAPANGSFIQVRIGNTTPNLAVDFGTDSQGGILQVVTVPANAGFGDLSFLVRVVGADGRNADSTGQAVVFTVTAGPANLSLRPTSGPRGTVVILTGQNFSGMATRVAANNVMIGNVGWNTAGQLPSGSPAGSAGINAGEIAVVAGSLAATNLAVPPNAAYGVNTVQATDNSGPPGRAGVASFTVTQPTIALAPQSGVIGTGVTVTGAGWLSNSTVTVTVNNTSTGQQALSTSGRVDASGRFSLRLAIPPGAFNGGNSNVLTFTANDGPSVGNVSSAQTFTIPPATISVTPSTAKAGDSVKVQGSGFLGFTQVSAIMVGNTAVQVGGISTDAEGKFEATAVLPLLPGAQALSVTIAGVTRTAPISIEESTAALSGRAIDVLGSLIDRVRPERSLLSVAWAQDLNTGEFKFLAPGVATSTLQTLEPNMAVFVNLTTPARLQISGRDPILVPAGGRWVTLGDLLIIAVVP